MLQWVRTLSLSKFFIEARKASEGQPVDLKSSIFIHEPTHMIPHALPTQQLTLLKQKKKGKKKSVRPYHRNGSQKVPRTRNNSDFQCYDNNESTCASCSLLHQVFMITWVYMVKQSTLSSGTTALYKHVVHCFLSAVLSKGHNRLSNCRRRRCCCCAETLLASRCWAHGVVVFGCRPGLVFRLGLLVYKVLSSV